MADLEDIDRRLRHVEAEVKVNAIARNGIERDLDQLKSGLTAVNTILQAVQLTESEQNATLRLHTAKHEAHTKILNEHTAKLDAHTVALTQLRDGQRDLHEGQQEALTLLRRLAADNGTS